MTLRRLFVGVSVVFGVSVWSWCHAGEDEAERSEPAHAVHATADATGGGNQDEAAYRFRTGQARHWRHVMIGGR